MNSIHIRYEDTITNPQHPMAAGATLDSIEMQVTCVCVCVCLSVSVCLCSICSVKAGTKVEIYPPKFLSKIPLRL